MKKGIVLISLGHPYYGRMAYNLALTLKANDSTCSISLIHNESSISHLNNSRISIFDNLIQITDSKYWTVCNKMNYAYSKLFLYELTPYEETIFLDVDTVWCSPKIVSNLFKLFKNKSLAIKNRNTFDFETGNTSDGKEFVYWANPEHVKEAYNFSKGLLHGLALEFMYFKKCKKVDSIFETALEIANNPKVTSTTLWAGQNNADELPLSISLVHHGYTLSVGFNPVHWGVHDSYFLSRTQIINNYYLLSTGGNQYDRRHKLLYNDLVTLAATKLNMPKGFAHADKKSFLPERQSI